MDKEAFCSLLKKIDQIEKTYGDFENFVISSTIGLDQHKMKIEDFSSAVQEMSQVYQELSDLDLADLEDFQEYVGRFDGRFD